MSIQRVTNRAHRRPESWKAQLAGVAVLCTLIMAGPLPAVSPASIELGRQLFVKNWSPQNAALMGKDGLGPLFNGQSCAACHRQGGIGGAGEAEFNAKTISIESMEVTGAKINLDVVRAAIRGFHPGFIDPNAGIVNSLALHHHGGSAEFDALRRQFVDKVPAVFSQNGGPVNAEEVRRANATPIVYSSTSGPYQTTILAHLFQRNTTPLFGSGLIDQVTVKQLRAVEREQRKHSEISGRLATLPDGLIGRFGWRGNVPRLLNFCDQACAAEVGLETRRINQPADPMAPAYRNPTHDISDDQIRAMTSFVAALPAPTRAIPHDSDRRRQAFRGEQLFSTIGCATCHRPNLGPASGLYSDLLLHDMGHESYDLNPADPYIVRATPISRIDFTVDTASQSTRTIVDDTVMGTAYYGGNYSMEPGQSQTGSTKSRTTTVQNPGRMQSSRPGAANSTYAEPSGFGALNPGSPPVVMTDNLYRFRASPRPPMTMRFISKGRKSRSWSDSDSKTAVIEAGLVGNQRTASGKDTYKVEVSNSRTRKVTQTQTNYLRIHMEPTNFTQEWRTPPLWGVHDSAPYMHDGRAETLLEAITMHDGEAKGTLDRFLQLSLDDRKAVIEFLHTLVAPPNAPQPTS